MSRWLDALERRQASWRAGLPWSRFGPPGLAFGVLLLIAAVRYPDTTPWASVVGALLLVIGVFSLLMERRVRAQREEAGRG